MVKSLRYKLKIEEELRSCMENPSVCMGSDDHMTPPALPLTTKIQLPKLVLRRNVTNWPSFWDAFKTAVHENDEISKKVQLFELIIRRSSGHDHSRIKKQTILPVIMSKLP